MPVMYLWLLYEIAITKLVSVPTYRVEPPIDQETLLTPGEPGSGETHRTTLNNQPTGLASLIFTFLRIRDGPTNCIGLED